MEECPETTVPPLSMVRVAVPWRPIYSQLLLFHCEPAPLTVTAPSANCPQPMKLLGLALVVTTPPSEIARLPVPMLPTYRASARIQGLPWVPPPLPITVSALPSI